MTPEHKPSNREIAEFILGYCSCREDWSKRDMRDPECQWCENGDLFVEALDAKDAEIARLESRIRDLEGALEEIRQIKEWLIDYDGAGKKIGRSKGIVRANRIADEVLQKGRVV